jgi:dedicated sortase system histidine kinase
MTLKRQLLLVSLLTLMLPWAGCEFIRETESALRLSQQQMLAGTARAIADSLAQYPEEFPAQADTSAVIGDQLYGHRLEYTPNIDGYFDDWSLTERSLRSMQGSDGPIRFIFGLYEPFVYLYVEVADRNVKYADAGSLVPNEGSQHADRVRLISASPPYLEESFSFTAEAPGPVVTYIQNAYGFAPEATIHAYWQDVPGGYQLEARIPRNLLGTHLGLVINNTADTNDPGIRSASFATRTPGQFVSTSGELTRIAEGIVQQGMRLIVTDALGWRISMVGDTRSQPGSGGEPVSAWQRFVYDALVEPGKESTFAEPDPNGREKQSYITTALGGRQSAAWFRSYDSGRAIVAVAEPVISAGETIGAVVLQQDTDAVLSLTNQTLARLMNVTVIAMLVVAGVLLGYASLLSRRIRRLSTAAEQALERDKIEITLPSADSADEIGDLSRSFGYVLGQLGDYNEYLRTLASKLSHELRTPLAIVSSSLDNLEHEALSDSAVAYTARAKDGADRLHKILSAMSEASRVEELMKDADTEDFDVRAVLDAAVNAYRDVYAERSFVFDCDGNRYPACGSPELLIQMLDKLVDNAVSFSAEGDEIAVALSFDGDETRIDVTNPGPPLPERMRTQMFDSMVSMRPHKDNKHLGLGLYIAKLIAEGHGGRIEADNIEGGVRFSVLLPLL